MGLGRRSAGGMSWRSCAYGPRRLSYTYNFPGVLDLNTFTELALRMMAVRGSSRGR